MPKILGPACYAHIFEPHANQQVGYLRANGNIGDWLIDAATRQLCEYFDIELIDVTAGDSLPNGLEAIFSAGAGNFGRYQIEVDKREWAVRTGLPVVVLPQTLGGSLEWTRNYDRVFFRDHTSLASHRRGQMGADLALAYDCPQFNWSPRDVGMFLRRGWKETPETHPEDQGDPAGKAATVEDYLKLASSYKHIITNRLHFAIAGLLQSRKVTLVPNAYHKNRSMWESSLWQFGCQWAYTAADAWKAATC